MTHALINADGEITFARGEWRPKVGPEGPSRVRLMPEAEMSGWVNDCGLVLPDRYARNEVGGLVLACLGAGIQPHAGPVVITGWHQCGTCTPHEEDLDERAISYLTLLVEDIGRALDGRPVSEELDGTDWAESIRTIARVIRTGEVPPIVIRTSGALRGFGGSN